MCGRGGEIRTPNIRIWNPTFCHWNYTPAMALHYTYAIFAVKRKFHKNAQPFKIPPPLYVTAVKVTFCSHIFKQIKLKTKLF